MARNIEIKARIASIDDMIERVRPLADSAGEEIAQDDTFFNCPNGRLKLRVFADGRGELIFYRRANQGGPKTSFYERAKTESPDALRACLKLAYGEAGRVRKRRWLFMIGRTRVHLDRVEGLGDFLELEVVLAEDEPAAQGEREARELMSLLELDDEALVEGAYHDLLKQPLEPLL